MPISGKILEINEPLVETPEELNHDVYENGWLVKVEATADAAAEMTDLMEYEDYKESVH